MSLKPQKTSLIMDGSGYQVISKRYNEYQFCSVINPTDNTIEVHEGQVTTGEEQNSVITILPFSQLTIPINNVQNFTFIYTDGGAAGTKKADVLFSEENLMYSGTMGTSVSGDINITLMPATSTDNATGLPSKVMVVAGYDGTNVQVIKTDAAGELQVDVMTLPAIALAASTNNIGDVDVLTLPAISLAASTNNIGDVDVLTLPAISLAASTNNIGDVDVLTLPNVTLNGYTFANDAANHTVNALKTGAGVLHGININTVGTTSTLTLYDGLTVAGTKIATIDTSVKGFHEFDAAFVTGLTYVTAGGAAADITLMYR